MKLVLIGLETVVLASFKRTWILGHTGTHTNFNGKMVKEISISVVKYFEQIRRKRLKQYFIKSPQSSIKPPITRKKKELSKDN